jgi:hypothetical protein
MAWERRNKRGGLSGLNPPIMTRYEFGLSTFYVICQIYLIAFCKLRPVINYNYNYNWSKTLLSFLSD